VAPSPDSRATTEEQARELAAGQGGRVFSHLEDRILTHWYEARMILDGKMPPPRTAIVYPTYICNQNCIWCEYSAENNEIHASMPDEALRHLIWDLQDLGVRGVEFCGGGEPSMHPALPDLIRDMHERGMSVGLLTNGTKLKGELASALVDCASYVRVGFDGATEETVHKVKRPRAPETLFPAVCKTIRDLVQLRNGRGTGVLISMKAVLDSNNMHEMEQCVQLAMDIGMDSVQFKAARLCDSELDATQTELVEREIAVLRERYPDIPVVGGTRKLNMTSQCWLTPLQIMVDTLGDVYLCCYYVHRKRRHSIGNCFETPLKDLWYSERHWEAIRGIVPRECNNLDCRFVHYNRIMDEVMSNGGQQFEFI
jgi:MoaA/NifB/PqqE/SkfB family radical SAM enzyme